MENFLKTFDLTVIDLQMIIVWTFAFVLLWRLLGKFFIKPYLQLFEAREAATIAARETAAELNRAADELKEQYDRRIATERAKFVQQKQEVLDRSRAEASSIVAAAERESKEYRETFRGELQVNLGELKTAAASQTGSLAALLVEKLRKIPEEAQAGN